MQAAHSLSSSWTPESRHPDPHQPTLWIRRYTLHFSFECRTLNQQGCWSVGVPGSQRLAFAFCGPQVLLSLSLTSICFSRGGLIQPYPRLPSQRSLVPKGRPQGSAHSSAGEVLPLCAEQGRPRRTVPQSIPVVSPLWASPGPAAPGRNLADGAYAEASGFDEGKWHPAPGPWSDLAPRQLITDTSFLFHLACGKCPFIFKRRGPIFNVTLVHYSIELTIKREDPSGQNHYPQDKMIKFTAGLLLININEM